MYKSLLLIVITTHVLADNSITINKQQLDITQQQLQKSGKLAIDKITQTKQALSEIKLDQLNLSKVESEITLANPMFQHTTPLTNNLPSGDKYYLYSKSVVSDTKQALTQYKTPLDINQTITDYNALIKNAKGVIGDSRLLIFISSSMPKKTIINLMHQATPLNAVFVVRGLINGSYVNTYRYFYNLKGDNNIGVMINPALFKVMQINAVPSFALYQSDQDLMHTACNTSPKYTKVSGEVSVHYALEQLRRSNNADLSQIANNELDILDNSNFYTKGKK